MSDVHLMNQHKNHIIPILAKSLGKIYGDDDIDKAGQAFDEMCRAMLAAERNHFLWSAEDALANLGVLDDTRLSWKPFHEKNKTLTSRSAEVPYTFVGEYGDTPCQYFAAVRRWEGSPTTADLSFIYDWDTADALLTVSYSNDGTLTEVKFPQGMGMEKPYYVGQLSVKDIEHKFVGLESDSDAILDILEEVAQTDWLLRQVAYK